ncbi:ABC transporter permease [Streptomyces sp. A7024]|uniref:Transport permease protein n=1 Tax=Streptomyces coryli TaxID=1128680 RepID=A0A6G4TVW4_9ACTN|nr:ABC transporter permease [Streptomyces coryli]NGN64125.1 ABC transporter permease [Streptomyces coryli]
MSLQTDATIPGKPARGSALTWAVVDGWTMTRRGFAHWARQPGPQIAGLLFSVMLLTVFYYLFGGGMTIEGGGDYKEFLIPGMLALTMAFGLETTMTELTQDLNKGVIDRFRSMPMARSAVLVGRSLTDMAQSVVGLLVLIGAGLAMGWRWHGSAGAALAAVGLLLLLRFAMLWLGIFLGLVAGRPEMVMAVQILVWPIGFLSSAITSPGMMPGWLGTIAEWNPMSATATAARDLFGNDLGATGGSWVVEHAVLMAAVWPVLLIAVFFPLAVRKYQRLSR